VAAVASRDKTRAASVVREYHQLVLERITAVREGAESTASEAGLTEALTAWLHSNVSLGDQVADRRSTFS
jgi:hypothetical protein